MVRYPTQVSAWAVCFGHNSREAQKGVYTAASIAADAVGNTQSSPPASPSLQEAPFLGFLLWADNALA